MLFVWGLSWQQSHLFLIYIAGLEYFYTYGYEAISTLDMAPEVQKIDSTNSYMKAMSLFDRFQQHVRNCDIIIVNLNDYRGYEINNDVAFEYGMGFELGKNCTDTWMIQIS